MHAPRALGPYCIVVLETHVEENLLTQFQIFVYTPTSYRYLFVIGNISLKLLVYISSKFSQCSGHIWLICRLALVT